MKALHSRRVSRRPGGRAALRLTLTLAALALLGASGCTLPPRVDYVGYEGGSLSSDDSLAWPRPVRVGVVGGDFGRTVALREQIVDALGEGVDRVVHGYRPGRSDERVDFVVKVDIDVRGSGRATNFLATFPGFVIFMPTWYQLRYDYEVTTHVRLWPGRARDDGVSANVERRPRTLTLTDRFLVRHTPPGVAVGAYVGWGAIVFPPLLISPLVTGVVAAVDEWDPYHFVHLLAHDSPAGYRYAHRVARVVRGMIDDELRYE